MIIERGYRPSRLCRPSVKLTPQNMPDRNDSTIIQLHSSSEKRGRDVESLISMISNHQDHHHHHHHRQQGQPEQRHENTVQYCNFRREVFLSCSPSLSLSCHLLMKRSAFCAAQAFIFHWGSRDNQCILQGRGEGSSTGAWALEVR